MWALIGGISILVRCVCFCRGSFELLYDRGLYTDQRDARVIRRTVTKPFYSKADNLFSSDEAPPLSPITVIGVGIIGVGIIIIDDSHPSQMCLGWE